jgi:hypothetical protein
MTSQSHGSRTFVWLPACAGMTEMEGTRVPLLARANPDPPPEPVFQVQHNTMIYIAFIQQHRR